MPEAARAADPIKLGSLKDPSNNFVLAKIGKVHGARLAAGEVDAAGHKLDHALYGSQFDNTRCGEFKRSTGPAMTLMEQIIDTIGVIAQRCFATDEGRVTAEPTPDVLDDRDLVQRHLAV